MLLSCDPGTKHCAFAIYENGKLVDACKTKATFEKLKEFFKELDSDEFVFVIEDQYLNLNVNTLKKLVEIRATVTVLARMFGAVKCIVVPPQKWQRTMLGVNIRAKREQRKRVSCMVASSIVGKGIADNDIADAICIGDYANRQKRLRSNIAKCK